MYEITDGHASETYKTLVDLIDCANEWHSYKEKYTGLAASLKQTAKRSI